MSWSEHWYMPVGGLIGAALGALAVALINAEAPPLDWANATGMGLFLGVAAAGVFYLRRP
jgi:hypothetical protein